MTPEEFVIWLGTATLGAGIVKAFDYFFERKKNKKEKLDKKVEKVINHLNDYGELTNLYRFYSNLQISTVLDENGKPLLDEKGERIVNINLFEPKKEYTDAIFALKDADLSSVIMQKIVTINLQSAEIHDILTEIDPSGKLGKLLTDLYNKNVIEVNNILNNPNLRSPGNSFSWMVSTLREADELRRDIRKLLDKHQ